MGGISTGRNSKVKSGCLSAFEGLHLRELMSLCQAHWELALGRVGLQLRYRALTQDYQQAITSDAPLMSKQNPSCSLTSVGGGRRGQCQLMGN